MIHHWHRPPKKGSISKLIASYTKRQNSMAMTTGLYLTKRQMGMLTWEGYNLAINGYAEIFSLHSALEGLPHPYGHVFLCSILHPFQNPRSSPAAPSPAWVPVLRSPSWVTGPWVSCYFSRKKETYIILHGCGYLPTWQTFSMAKRGGKNGLPTFPPNVLSC